MEFRVVKLLRAGTELERRNRDRPAPDRAAAACRRAGVRAESLLGSLSLSAWTDSEESERSPSQ